MNKTSMILSAVMMGALLVLFMPGVFAANRGKVLRNIALWLAIFTGLALVYKNFGPGSEHPLFSAPTGMVQKPGDATVTKPGAAKSDEDKTDGSQGYSPPSE